MKFRRRAMAAVFAFAVTLGLSATPVWASCVPANRSGSFDNQFHHVARGQGGTGLYGVKSDLNTYSPYVPLGGYSYAWVMLTKPANYYWAQVGNYAAYQGRATTVQYSSGGSHTQVDFSPQTVGSTQNYAVTYYAPTGTFNFLLNGNVFFYAYLNWAPSGAQIAAEIWQLPTQMMGAVQAHQLFSNNQVKFYSNAWQSFTGTLQPYDSYFGESGYAGSFQAWDKGCSGT